MKNEIQFTGERCVPNRTCHPQTLAEHLIRYSFATKYAKVGKMLDVACGTGYGLNVMGILGAYKHGADISKEAIECSKEVNENKGNFYQMNFEKENLNIHFDYENDRDSFGLITSFETIEHLENPNLLLQGINQILKSDGKFVYSIPLNNPSNYHKVVYTFESAYDLISKYFDHEEIYIQEELELVRFSRLNGNVSFLNKRGVFVIGVCHKKK